MSEPAAKHLFRQRRGPIHSLDWGDGIPRCQAALGVNWGNGQGHVFLCSEPKTNPVHFQRPRQNRVRPHRKTVTR